jgi:CHAT domain
MPIVYNVSIQTASDIFKITWENVANKDRYCLRNNLAIIDHEDFKNWETSSKQLKIGEALFHFLDGDSRYFSQILDKGYKRGETLRINLSTCKETADWPFELIAWKGNFLSFNEVALVRRVTDHGILANETPREGLLKLLFMVSSGSGLKYEKEEEEIREITEEFAFEMETEDLGTLGGLQNRLVHRYYDIVHLTGHANIDGEDQAFIYGSQDSQEQGHIKPRSLWADALIENPPQILFLSGCRSGQMSAPLKPGYVESYAKLMVEEYRIPAVMGWGRNVDDTQAIHAEKMIYYELSRGRSILEAIQRARVELWREFNRASTKNNQDTPSTWPLLRLYCDGSPLNPIIEAEQVIKINPLSLTEAYLKENNINQLKKGFIGRRSQLQISQQTLNHNKDRFGLLVLGAGGLGKTCLAAKLCLRFPQHRVIALQGKLDDYSIQMALKDAFTINRDSEGLSILKRNIDMADKLAHLCATSFQQNNYILLLDGFDQNLETLNTGRPDQLLSQAAALLKELLNYIHFCGKMTHLIITSRYDFSLSHNHREMVSERLEKVWLNRFWGNELTRIIDDLPTILARKEMLIWQQVVDAGCGNPLLMKQIDQIATQVPANETSRLLELAQKARDDYFQQLGLKDLLKSTSGQLQRFLEGFKIYTRPVAERQLSYIAKKADIDNWQDQLNEALGLGLLNYDQNNRTYSLTMPITC